MKKKIIHDDECFGRYLGREHTYYEYSPNQLFDEDPEYLLWLHLNIKAFTFTEGIRKKLNKYKTLHPGVAKKLTNL